MAIQNGAPLAANTCLQIQGDCGPFTFYTRHRGLAVWFPRADIGKAPSEKQIEIRYRMKLIGLDWSTIGFTERQKWKLLAERNYTRLTGYNLFTLMEISVDGRAYLRNLIRHANLPVHPMYFDRSFPP